MTVVEMNRCDFCLALGEAYAELTLPFAMAPGGFEAATDETATDETVTLHVCAGKCRGVVSGMLAAIANARREDKVIDYRILDPADLAATT